MAPYTPSHAALYRASVSLASTTFASGISYGLMTALYSICMYNLVRELRSQKATKRIVLLTLWVTILWTLSTISTIANAYFAIYAYSFQLDYPGGPAVYLGEQWDAPLSVLAFSTYILTMWFADALMLWRLYIFYHAVHPFARGLLCAFMSLIYIGTLGTGCFTMIILSWNQTLYSEYAMKAAIPFFTLSVSLNVFATGFIIFQLVLFKRLMEETLGRKEARASPYTSIAAVFIESAALYAVWSLVFIIVYAANDPAQYIMLMTLCNVQVIAPVLIVLRLSKGMGWEQTTSAKIKSALAMLSQAEAQVKSEVMPNLEHQESSSFGLHVESVSRSGEQ